MQLKCKIFRPKNIGNKFTKFVKLCFTYIGNYEKNYLGEKELMTRPAGAAIFPFVTA